MGWQRVVEEPPSGQLETGTPPGGGDEDVKLQKHVGLVGGISFVVGTVIGSGIFITPQGVLQNTGSVGLCMVLWALGGVLSMLGALTYSELASVVRKSGGQYAYLNEALGPIPAFLVVWTREVAMSPSSTAVVSLTFAEYFESMFVVCGSPELPKKLIAILLIMTLSIINCFSPKLATRVQVVFTGAKLLALLMIVTGGIVWMSKGVTSDLMTGFTGTTDSPASVALALYFVMFSYGGWNNANNLLEEVENPRRNVPLSSIVGVLVTAFVYILTNVSYLAVLSKKELFTSTAVAVTWGDRVMGAAGLIIPLSVMCSTFGALNGGLFSSSRITFAAARDGNFPEFLSYIHVKHYSPIPSILFHIFFAIIMILEASIMSLLRFLSFLAWFFYALSAVSVIVLRFTREGDPQRIKIPMVNHVLFLIVSVFLVLTPIIDYPRIEFLYAVVFCVGGLVFYIPFVHYKLKPRFLDTFEMYLQLFLEVVPSPQEVW
ncbi:b(0,+)-type amino acid transporter 1-like [Haliotis rufescens]|uniref:b(0,+)-type amino acid transporter 1-like n=1 Tax=Haliotis rufescens TaxID=6454 RepID=UPI00201F012C|nr:b(0,+)-type amino acid transporter 1-like [Haliotis rufescens]